MLKQNTALDRLGDIPSRLDRCGRVVCITNHQNRLSGLHRVKSVCEPLARLQLPLCAGRVQWGQDIAQQLTHSLGFVESGVNNIKVVRTGRLVDTFDSEARIVIGRLTGQGIAEKRGDGLAGSRLVSRLLEESIQDTVKIQPHTGAVQREPDGTLDRVVAYDGAIIPEWSIFEFFDKIIGCRLKLLRRSIGMALCEVTNFGRRNALAEEFR